MVVIVSGSVGDGGSRLACREVPLLDVVVRGDNNRDLGCSAVGSDRCVDHHHLRDTHCDRSDRSDRSDRRRVIHCSASTGRRCVRAAQCMCNIEIRSMRRRVYLPR